MQFSWKILSNLLVLLLACQGFSWPACAAETVAMITDLEGKAVMKARNTNMALSILAVIRQDEQMQVENGARVVAVYVDSSLEYEFKGPALIQFGKQQPESLSGSAPIARGAVLGNRGKEVRIKPVEVAQAAYVMRDIKPIAKEPVSQDVQEEMEKLRPPAGAAVSERVVFAAWLEHRGLKDEASKYWKAIAAERPDDPQLQRLAKE